MGDFRLYTLSNRARGSQRRGKDYSSQIVLEYSDDDLGAFKKSILTFYLCIALIFKASRFILDSYEGH